MFMQIVSILLLALHLLCMNLASALPLVCVWTELTSRDRDPQSDGLRNVRRWAMHAWLAIFAGIALGLLLGSADWLRGDGRLFEVLPVFRKKVFWGVAEIGCSLIWTGLYWAWLRRGFPLSRGGRAIHRGLALLSATNLLYHFPILLHVMRKASIGNNELPVGPMTSSDFRVWAYQQDVVAQASHFFLASLAVAGTWLLVLKSTPVDWRKRGACLALVATLLQIPVGIWLLVALPASEQTQLLGKSMVAAVTFIVAMLAVFALLQNLAAAAFGEVDQRHSRKVAVLLFTTVLLMSASLRLSYLNL